MRVVFDDAFTLEIMFDFEFCQSDPDREKFVPSLRIEPDLAPQLVICLVLDSHDLFPTIEVLTEKAVVFGGPALGSICPVRADSVEDFP